MNKNGNTDLLFILFIFTIFGGAVALQTSLHHSIGIYIDLFLAFGIISKPIIILSITGFVLFILSFIFMLTIYKERYELEEHK